MHLPAILFGAIVGISLGLTGGGGGILAVPMLVYGVGVEPHPAILVSLIAVAATALVGAVERMRRGEVDVRIGVMFALAGLLGAPLGAWVAHRIAGDVLLILFSMLMIYVASKMWRRGSNGPQNSLTESDSASNPRRGNGMMMAALGIATGVLSGLFGVGGGFVIVPALVLVGHLPIHRAVATSLLVIPLMSVSGIATHLWALHEFDARVTALFVLGGVGGMWLGTLAGRRLSAAKLQKAFAVVIVAVAVFNVVMTMWKSEGEPRSPGDTEARRVDRDGTAKLCSMETRDELVAIVNATQ